MAEASIKDEVQECLDAFLDDPLCDRLEPIARTRLTTLLDQLGPELNPYPIEVTERMLRFISTCTRRSVYLSLLSENPATRTRMLDILDRSSWVTERLVEMPALLDEYSRLMQVTPRCHARQLVRNYQCACKESIQMTLNA